MDTIMKDMSSSTEPSGFHPHTKSSEEPNSSIDSEVAPKKSDAEQSNATETRINNLEEVVQQLNAQIQEYTEAQETIDQAALKGTQEAIDEALKKATEEQEKFEQIKKKIDESINSAEESLNSES